MDLKSIIISFMKKNQWWVWITLGSMVVNFPIELILLSYLSGKIFTKMSDMKKNYASVIRLVMLFLFSYFLLEICIIVRDRCDASFIPGLEKEIRNQIIIMIFEKNEVQYDNLEMGEMVARFLKTPIHSFYAYGVITKFLIPFVSALIVIGIYVFYLNCRLGFMYLGIYTAYLVLFYHTCRVMVSHTTEKIRCEMVMFNDLEDTLSNMHTILTSDKIEDEKARMDVAQDYYNGVYTNNLAINTRFKLIMSIVSLISVSFLFFYSIRLFRDGLMSQEVLVSVVVLLVFMTRFLGYTCRRLMEGMLTIGSMMEGDKFMSDLKKETAGDGEAIDCITEGKIVFDGVSFGYHTDVRVFDGLSVDIPARSRLLLLGDSGSGKTTFIRLLMGFFTLTAGTISIDGKDISSINRSYLRRNIAYVNQTTRLFDRSIMENILYGCSDSTPEDVRSFIVANGLSDIFRLYDLDNKAGRGGENLSGGMRQVVLLMRCFFRDCPIIILDEATSSIDKRHRHHAIMIMRRMFEKKTVIAVSHDSDITDLFDRRLVFSSDRVEYTHPSSSG